MKIFRYFFSSALSLLLLSHNIAAHGQAAAERGPALGKSTRPRLTTDKAMEAKVLPSGKETAVVQSNNDPSETATRRSSAKSMKKSKRAGANNKSDAQANGATNSSGSSGVGATGSGAPTVSDDEAQALVDFCKKNPVPRPERCNP